LVSSVPVSCAAFPWSNIRWNLGTGVVVHLPSFFKELESLQAKGALAANDGDSDLRATGLDCTGRLFVSDRAHLVFDFHQIVDGLKEAELGGSSIGTTKKGIGPAYSSKASRSGLRVHHLYDREGFAAKLRKLVEGRFKRYGHFDYDTEAEIKRYAELADRLRPHVVDSVAYIHAALDSQKRVLVEGANALMLDLDFGTYPYVTSSSTTVGGVCTGLGIPPQRIGAVFGVVKAYMTRVGGGPFPTELDDVRRSARAPAMPRAHTPDRPSAATCKKLAPSTASSPAGDAAAAGSTSSPCGTPAGSTATPPSTSPSSTSSTTSPRSRSPSATPSTARP
jgi:adenylosuccinate synthase